MFVRGIFAALLVASVTCRIPLVIRSWKDVSVTDTWEQVFTCGKDTLNACFGMSPQVFEMTSENGARIRIICTEFSTSGLPCSKVNATFYDGYTTTTMCGQGTAAEFSQYDRIGATDRMTVRLNYPSRDPLPATLTCYAKSVAPRSG